jgi:hypothetical protein
LAELGPQFTYWTRPAQLREVGHACGWISGISSRKLESGEAYLVLFGQRP